MNWLYSPLKSYIESLLLKYFSNVDFQNFGILGGEIVLRDLELRLDVLQQSLKIPLSFAFSRGYIKELKISIPWGSLFSKPIEIKVSTIECILTARSHAQYEKLQKQYETADVSSSRLVSVPEDRLVEEDRPELKYGRENDFKEQGRRSSGDAPREANWLQDSFTTVLANSSLEITNLVLKYEHSDVVLSTSVKSIKAYSASPSSSWQRNYQPLNDEYKTLYKVCSLDGVTICLDRASDRPRTISSEVITPMSPAGSPLRRTITVFEVPILKRAEVNIRAMIRLSTETERRSNEKDTNVSARNMNRPQEAKSTPRYGKLRMEHELSETNDPFLSCVCVTPYIQFNTNSPIVASLALSIHFANLNFSLSDTQLRMLNDLAVLPDEEPEIPFEPKLTEVKPFETRTAESKANHSASSNSTVIDTSLSQSWSTWLWNHIGPPETNESPVNDVESELLELARTSIEKSAKSTMKGRIISFVSIGSITINESSLTLLLREEHPISSSNRREPEGRSVSIGSNPEDLSYSGSLSENYLDASFWKLRETPWEERKRKKQQVIEIAKIVLQGIEIELRDDAAGQEFFCDLATFRVYFNSSFSYTSETLSAPQATASALNIGYEYKEMTTDLLSHPSRCWSFFYETNEVENSIHRCRLGMGVSRNFEKALRLFVRRPKKFDDSISRRHNQDKKQHDAFDVAIGPVSIELSAGILQNLNAFFRSIRLKESPVAEMQSSRNEESISVSTTSKYGREREFLITGHEFVLTFLGVHGKTKVAVEIDISSISVFCSTRTSSSNPLSEQVMILQIGKEAASSDKSFDEVLHWKASVAEASILVRPSTNQTFKVKKDRIFHFKKSQIGFYQGKQSSLLFAGFSFQLNTCDISFSLAQADDVIETLFSALASLLIDLKDVSTYYSARKEDVREKLTTVKFEIRDCIGHAKLQVDVNDNNLKNLLDFGLSMGQCSLRMVSGHSQYVYISPFYKAIQNEKMIQARIEATCLPSSIMLDLGWKLRFWNLRGCSSKHLLHKPSVSLAMTVGSGKVAVNALVLLYGWYSNLSKTVSVLYRKDRQKLVVLDSEQQFAVRGSHSPESQDKDLKNHLVAFDVLPNTLISIETGRFSFELSPHLCIDLPTFSVKSANTNHDESITVVIQIQGVKAVFRETMNRELTLMDDTNISIQNTFLFKTKEIVCLTRWNVAIDVSPLKMLVTNEVVSIVSTLTLFNFEVADQSKSDDSRNSSQKRKWDINVSCNLQIQFLELNIMLPRTARLVQLDGSLFHQASNCCASVEQINFEYVIDDDQRAIALSILDISIFEQYESQVNCRSSASSNKSINFSSWMLIFRFLSWSDTGNLACAYGARLVPKSLRNHVIEQILLGNSVYILRLYEGLAQQIVKHTSKPLCIEPSSCAVKHPILSFEKRTNDYYCLSFMAKYATDHVFYALSAESIDLIYRKVTFLGLHAILDKLLPSSNSTNISSDNQKNKSIRIIVKSGAFRVFFPASAPVPMFRRAFSEISTSFVVVSMGILNFDIGNNEQGSKNHNIMMPSFVVATGFISESQTFTTTKSTGISNFFRRELGLVLEFFEDSKIIAVPANELLCVFDSCKGALNLRFPRLDFSIQTPKVYESLTNALELASISNPVFWRLVRDSFLDKEVLDCVARQLAQKSTGGTQSSMLTDIDISVPSITIHLGSEELNNAVFVLRITGININRKTTTGSLQINHVECYGFAAPETLNAPRIRRDLIHIAHDQEKPDVSLTWFIIPNKEPRNGISTTTMEFSYTSKYYMDTDCIMEIVRFCNVASPIFQFHVTKQSATELLMLKRRIIKEQAEESESSRRAQLKIIVPSVKLYFGFVNDGPFGMLSFKELYCCMNGSKYQELDLIIIGFEIYVADRSAQTISGEIDQMIIPTVRSSDIKIWQKIGMAPYGIKVQCEIPGAHMGIDHETIDRCIRIKERLFDPLYEFWFADQFDKLTPRVDGLLSMQDENATKERWDNLKDKRVSVSKQFAPGNIKVGGRIISETRFVALKDMLRSSNTDDIDLVFQDFSGFDVSELNSQFSQILGVVEWKYTIPTTIKGVKFLPFGRMEDITEENLHEFEILIHLSYWDKLRKSFCVVYSYTVQLLKDTVKATEYGSDPGSSFADAFNTILDVTLGNQESPAAVPVTELFVNAGLINPAEMWCLAWSSNSAQTLSKSTIDLISDFLRKSTSVYLIHDPTYHKFMDFKLTTKEFKVSLLHGSPGKELICCSVEKAQVGYWKAKQKGCINPSVSSRLSGSISIYCNNFKDLSKAALLISKDLCIVTTIDPHGEISTEILTSFLKLNIERTLISICHYGLINLFPTAFSKKSESAKSNPSPIRSELGKRDDRCIRYMLVNNTGLKIHYGQYATSESLSLERGEEAEYSWRFCLSKSSEDLVLTESMRFAVECKNHIGEPGTWSQPVCIDTAGVHFRLLHEQEEAFQLWIDVYHEDNGLKTTIYLHSGVKVLNYCPNRFLIKFAEQEHELEAFDYEGGSCLEQNVLDFSAENTDTINKEIHREPEITISESNLSDYECRSPVGFLSCNTLQTPESQQPIKLNIMAPIASLKDACLQIRENDSHDWSLPIDLSGLLTNWKNDPILIELPAENKTLVKCLWLTVRKVHLKLPDNTPGMESNEAIHRAASGWNIIEIWPVGYIYNEMPWPILVRIRPEKRWESLELVMREDTSLESKETQQWQGVGSFAVEDAPLDTETDGNLAPNFPSESLYENRYAIEILKAKYGKKKLQDRKVQDSKSQDLEESYLIRIQSALRAPVFYDPRKPHILVIARDSTCAEETNEPDEWSMPGLRLSHCLFPPESIQLEKVLQLKRSRRLALRTGSSIDSMVAQALSSYISPSVWFKISPIVAIMNDSSHEIWIHFHDRKLIAEPDVPLKITNIEAIRHGISFSLDGLNNSKLIDLTESETHVLALPILQFEAEESATWVLQLCCEVNAENGVFETVIVKLHNRLLLHNNTGMNLRVQDRTSQNDKCRINFLDWNATESMTLWSLYRTTKDQEHKLKMEIPASEVLERYSTDGFLDLSAWKMQESVEVLKDPAITVDQFNLKTVNSGQELNAFMLSTELRLAVANFDSNVQIWSSRIIMPQLLGENEEQSGIVLVPNSDSEKYEMVKFSILEKGNTLHCTFSLENEPHIVIRNASKFPIFFTTERKSKTVALRVPSNCIVPFDEELLEHESGPMLDISDLDDLTVRTIPSLASKPTNNKQRVFQRSNTSDVYIGFDPGQCHSFGKNRMNASVHAALTSKLETVRFSDKFKLLPIETLVPFKMEGPSTSTMLLLKVQVRELGGSYIISIYDAVTHASEQKAGSMMTVALHSKRMQLSVQISEVSISLHDTKREILHGHAQKVKLISRTGNIIVSTDVSTDSTNFKTIDHAIARGNFAYRISSFKLLVKAIQVDSYIDESEFCILGKINAKASCDHAVDFSMRIFESSATGQTTFESVTLNLSPTLAYLEDVVLERLARVLAPISAIILAQRKLFKANLGNDNMDRPSKPSMRFATICGTGGFASATSPKSHVYIKRLTIGALEFELTVRATSLPMFLGTDETLIRFTELEISNIYAQSDYLFKELAANYIADALLNSPSLLGSLELIGNPAGLLRAIFSGMRDVVILPIQEFQQGFGPASILRGVTKGWISLVLHMSEGALSSIAGFSNSIARNLDKLSLDQEYISSRQRRRIWMKQRKAKEARNLSLARGFSDGLMRFGEGILGGATGVVRLPLQDSRTHGWRFHGILTGIGKGLAGVVTKPAGGAADFIAQTSNGIMEQAGMGTSFKLKPIRKESEPVCWSIDSRLHIELKLIPEYEYCLAHGAARMFFREQGFTQCDEIDQNCMNVLLVLSPLYFRIFLTTGGSHKHADVVPAYCLQWDEIIIYENVEYYDFFKIGTAVDKREWIFVFATPQERRSIAFSVASYAAAIKTFELHGRIPCSD